MSRTCKICGEARANEQFGGRGWRQEICRTCRSLPKAQRQDALWADEIYGFLWQKSISQKNIARLVEIRSVGAPHTAELAGIILENARVAPRKKNRIGRLRRDWPGLLNRAIALDLLSCEFDDSFPYQIEDLHPYQVEDDEGGQDTITWRSTSEWDDLCGPCR